MAPNSRFLDNQPMVTLLTKPSPRVFGVILFVLALALRLILGWMTDIPDNDECGYWRYAGHFLEYFFEGHPADPADALPFWFPPGVPALLAVFRAVVGDSVIVSRILMHVLAALIPLAVWIWGRSLLREGWSRLAALGMAFDPYMTLGSGRLETDHLFTLLVILCLFMRPVEKRSWLVTGLICGLLAWVRTATLFFLPALALEAWRQKGRAAGLKTLMLLVTGYALAMSPMLLRNRVLAGEWFLAPLPGFVLLSANNPNHASGSWVVEGQGLRRAITYNATTSQLAEDDAHLRTLPFLERDKIYLERAKAWLREHPMEYPLNALHRVIGLFHFYPPAHPDPRRIVPLAAMWVVTLLSFMGLALTWNRPAWAFCRVLFLSSVLTAALTMVIPRYRFPLHPVMFVTAAYALQRWSDRRAGRAEITPPTS